MGSMVTTRSPSRTFWRTIRVALPRSIPLPSFSSGILRRIKLIRRVTWIAHGITDNHDGTYTIKVDAEDFSYFVQIGNKGTWSQADVDVTAPPAACRARWRTSLQ